MPIPRDYLELVNALHQATVQQRVAWKPTRYGVKVDFGDKFLEFWSGVDEESEIPFVSCALHDRKSKLRSAADTWSVDRGDEQYDFLFELLNTAKRQGLGIPQMVASLKQALSEDKIIGAEVPDQDDEDIPF